MKFTACLQTLCCGLLFNLHMLPRHQPYVGCLTLRGCDAQRLGTVDLLGRKMQAECLDTVWKPKGGRMSRGVKIHCCCRTTQRQAGGRVFWDGIITGEANNSWFQGCDVCAEGIWNSTHRGVASCIHLCNSEQIELQAKLLNYFSGSNKSNINQNLFAQTFGGAPVMPRQGAVQSVGLQIVKRDN